MVIIQNTVRTNFKLPKASYHPILTQTIMLFQVKLIQQKKGVLKGSQIKISISVVHRKIRFGIFFLFILSLRLKH